MLWWAGGQKYRLPALQKSNDHCTPNLLSDRSLQALFDRQFMDTTAHRHERSAERVTIDRTTYLYQALCTKEPCGLWPNDVRPPPLFLTFLKPSFEFFV
jgi:hypothetical protein